MKSAVELLGMEKAGKGLTGGQLFAPMMNALNRAKVVIERIYHDP